MTTGGEGWVILIEQLAKDVRSLADKVDALKSQVQELKGKLEVHRKTGNGESGGESAGRRILGLTGKDALLVILAAGTGSNILNLVGLV